MHRDLPITVRPTPICPTSIRPMTIGPKTIWLKTMCAVSAFVLLLAAPLSAHHIKKGESATLPVTTSSPRARSLYEDGVADYENLYLERCNEDWRAAVKEDPNLAVAWV